MWRWNRGFRRRCEKIGAPRASRSRVLEPFSFTVGQGEAVMRDPKRAVNFAGADPRSDGEAIPESPNPFLRTQAGQNRQHSYVATCKTAVAGLGRMGQIHGLHVHELMHETGTCQLTALAEIIPTAPVPS